MRKDPLGYYAVLRVSPDADGEEIELAYSMLKEAYQDRREPMNIGQIHAAYDTLNDAGRRAAYDLRCVEASAPRAPVGKVGILLVLAALFCALFVFMYGQSVRVSMTSFSPGDTLYLSEDGSLFGTVLRFEKSHEFFNGAASPAYLVEQMPGEPGVWYPARDLAWICRR